MATEILRPQDSLIQRIRVSSCRRRNFHYHGHVNANYYSSNSSTSSSGASSNARFNRKPAAGQRCFDQQKKRHQTTEQSVPKRSTSADDLRISSKKNDPHHGHRHQSHHGHGHGHGHSQSLVMDNVTILRRGDSLDSRTVAGGGETISGTGTERIGPAPEVVPRQMRITEAKPGSRRCDVYAGSAFAMSPAPSALPLPSFSKKKQQVPVDDSATRDLRRLLRLDL